MPILVLQRVQNTDGEAGARAETKGEGPERFSRDRDSGAVDTGFHKKDVQGCLWGIMK